MQYALIWLEWLLIGIVFFTLGTSVFSRFTRREVQFWGSIGAAAIPGAVFISFSCLSWWLYTKNIRPTWLLLYFTSLTAVYLASVVVLVIRSRRQTDTAAVSRRRPLLRSVLVLILLASAHALTLQQHEQNLLDSMKSRRAALEITAIEYSREPPSPSQNAAPLLEAAAEILEGLELKYVETVLDITTVRLKVTEIQ